jgi:hypothetical protein
MFGGSPTSVFGPTVLASWTTLRQPVVLLLCFGVALRTMELEIWLLLLCGGQRRVRIPFSSFHWFARKETWHGALSSWKIQGLSEKLTQSDMIFSTGLYKETCAQMLRIYANHIVGMIKSRALKYFLVSLLWTTTGAVSFEKNLIN